MTERPPQRPKKPLHRDLFFQVIAAIAAGVLLGWLAPAQAVSMKPLGDAFIRLIKMLIAPIIFCTIVSGIAGMGNLRQVGRVGAKAIIYFEAVTTFALIIGMLLVGYFKPGSALHIDLSHVDTSAVKEKMAHAGTGRVADFFLGMIPDTMAGAFAGGEILQVLLVAILFACAISALGERGRGALIIIDAFSQVLFKMVDIVTRLAPFGAFGAMAYTVGKFGVGSLKELGEVILVFYGSAALFIALVLAPLLRFTCGLSAWRFLKYIGAELMIVLGTSSSETVLPRLMEKLVAMGCARPVVGLVVPAGYSFNLDGSSMYFSVGALFITYATGTPISFWQELTLLGVLLVTSKGAAGVTGSGFLVLAATLSSMHLIPPQDLEVGLALIFAVDRFMSTGRAIVNLIGNGIATVVIAKWENALDVQLASDVLAGRREPDMQAIER